MDFSKIKLKNERNEHVKKRLNRLGIFKFFGVLYRENIWRLFGFSILMLLCVAPIFGVAVWGSYNNAGFGQSLPMHGTIGGFGTGGWIGVEDYYKEVLNSSNIVTGAFMVCASLLVSIMLSGGFAVIRDAFWTGKLSTVGVFKSVGKGIKANIAYALVSNVIIAGMAYGLYCFYIWASVAIPLWAAILILVVLGLVAFLVLMYLLILCSVTVTYKQSVAENLDDAWRLMWLNPLPNILHLAIALLPIALYFAVSGSAFQSIFLVVIAMFGGMYIPLVWQTHMMKTFALFHPVETKKKKGGKKDKAPKSDKVVSASNADEGGAEVVTFDDGGEVDVDTANVVEADDQSIVDAEPTDVDEPADAISNNDDATADQGDQPVADDDKKDE